MDDRFSLTQLDVLKEIGTIGAANAATALADLVRAKVEINVPEVNIVPLENVARLLDSADKLYFVLDMEINGDVLGRIFLLLSPEDAKLLGSHLLGRPAEELDYKDEMFQSALKESANILCSSYITSLADMTRLTILSSVPTLAMDMVGAILDFIFIQIAQYSEEALFVKTNLKVEGENMHGLFLFFPSSDSLRKIFEILGVKE